MADDKIYQLSLPAFAVVLLRLKIARMCLQLALACGGRPELFRLTRWMLEGVAESLRSATL